MDIRFAALPVSFKFEQEYKRWKGTSSPVLEFDDPRLRQAVGQWESQTFSPGFEMTIVEQTRSLLGIRWKTADGLRFSTDEINSLIGSKIIRPIAHPLSLERKTPPT